LFTPPPAHGSLYRYLHSADCRRGKLRMAVWRLPGERPSLALVFCGGEISTMNEQTQKAQHERQNWHALTAEQVLSECESSEDGLSGVEAQRRLEKYGRNQLQQGEKRPAWKRFLDQFNNVLMIILLIAGVASLILNQVLDAGAIFAVVLIIAIVGFIQEGKAEAALENIKDLLSPTAMVQRDGERQEIAAEEVVRGDIVHFESGDRVPADIRLLRARRLRIEEASLTGESEAVDKDVTAVGEDADLAERSCMAFASTIIAQGQGTGVVVETGSHTQIGRISEMLATVEQVQTPLLRHLDHAGKVLALIIVGAAILVGGIAVFVHSMPLTEAFMASVALAVASIPEGLPAIVTITLALGVKSMARRHAIIRRLPAVETLGATTIIFSDKTGTLTRNEMTAQTLALPEYELQISGIGFKPEGRFSTTTTDRKRQEPGTVPAEPEQGPAESAVDPGDDALLQRFLRVGVLCSDANLESSDGNWTIKGDPTEGALVVAATKAGYDPPQLRQQYKRLDMIPFESEHKYMATLDQDNESESIMIHVKGAADTVIGMCNGERRRSGEAKLDPEQWQQRVEALSARGLRVLALAEKPAEDARELSDADVEHGLILLGLVGMLDPPRDAAIAAIGKCRTAGIRPVMVTGDHALTAQAIGTQLGLRHTDRAITGKELEKMSAEELKRRFKDVDIYARAAPEHKLRLIQVAQDLGEVCAMTGDGVNDAPALKSADVGVAMGIEGTEAAKETAEMVLADDNFASIVNAVEEGRKVYDNIKKTITFLLPTNGGQGLAIAVAMLVGTMLPVTPLQALWVNMIVAVTLGLALAFEPGEPDLMQRAPRDPHAPLLDMFLLWRVVFVSVLLLVGVYGMFLWQLHLADAALAVARSCAVNVLVFGSIAYLVNSRFLTGSSISRHGIFGSRPVMISIAAVVGMQIVWTYFGPLQALFGSAGLSWNHWAVILLISLAIFFLVEIEKKLWRRGAGS